ncbi:MAG TPA: biopolymer transporter ExbD [Saprospiraceae bacterium]|nr:biopolymer transporter ExbD [Saprospiraceae bacterium]
MGIKKKSKVSAAFNMSSLTDIIFLLLIFFMLTSSAIVPNALNLQLPGKKSTTPVESKNKPAVVNISSSGTFTLNGKNIDIVTLEEQLIKFKNAKGKDAVMSITPDAKASNDDVVAVMDIAYRFEIKAALNDPK